MKINIPVLTLYAQALNFLLSLVVIGLLVLILAGV